MQICHNVINGRGCGSYNPDSATECHNCAASLHHALRTRNPGSRVRHYSILRIIGYGRFGTVYEAVSPAEPMRRLALKETLRPANTSSFQREYEVLRHLDHPNLCRYYNSFVEQTSGYLVMELIPGYSLQELLKRQSPLPADVVLGEYLPQLTAALEYLHSQPTPILHRDIKPANIRLTPDGVVKLVDFGLLKRLSDETHPDIRGMGTASYAPPEQYGGGRNTDQRTDLYALAATLYHLLTGTPPPPATERIGMTPDPLPPANHLNPQLAPRVASVLHTALSLRRNDRYNTVQAFCDALSAASREQSLAVRGHRGKVLSVAHSPDGQTLASGSSAWTLRLWDAHAGTLLQRLDGHSGSITSIAYQPGGRLLASASNNGTVRLWDLAGDHQLLSMLQMHRGSIRSVAWNSSGELLASASDDRTITVWSIAARRTLHTLYGHSDGVLGLAWSPTDNLLASASADRTVRVWRIASGTLLYLLEGHTGAVRTVAWHPRGEFLASGDSNGKIQIWDAHGEQQARLDGHAGAVNSLVWHADGNALASAGDDGTLRIWRMPDGTLLDTLHEHTAAVNGVSVSPDGHGLVTAGSDNVLRRWLDLELPAKTPALAICQHK